MEGKVDSQGGRISKLEKEVEGIKKNGVPNQAPTGAGPSGVGGGVFGDYPPKSQRRTVVFCFWPNDTPKEEIVEDLKTFVEQHTLVDPDGFFAPARFCNRVKIRFSSPANMWKWVTAHKGKKFKGETLWWAIDKPLEEMNEAKKVRAAIKVLKDFAVSIEGELDDEVLEKRVPADYDIHFVMLKATVEARAVRIFDKPRGEHMWVWAAGAPELAGMDWVRALATINAGA